MNEALGKIALAGLLHDIGKFGQRAGEASDRGKDHAAVGDTFVNTHVPGLWQNALGPVSWHHGDPEGSAHELYPVQAVVVADRLSAGEREHRDENEEKHTTQMISPFSRLASPFRLGTPARPAFSKNGTLGAGPSATRLRQAVERISPRSQRTPQSA